MRGDIRRVECRHVRRLWKPAADTRLTGVEVILPERTCCAS